VPVGIHVRWLGHATAVLDVDGVRLLTDPLLRPHAGLLRRAAPRPDADHWRKPDAVLLSHLHHDHAELGSLRMVPGTPILTAPENARWLRRRGLTSAVALSEQAWRPLGNGVEVRRVPAVHAHRPMPHRPNEAIGHLVRGPSGTVWVAGDTDLYPGMAELSRLAGGSVDLALVPVWGWGPRLSPGHLDPADAATAVTRAGARWAVPVHWGTLHPPLVHRMGRGWLDRPGERFAEAVAALGGPATAVVLRPGERWSVPRSRAG
jgi:L-ascorbate metabolism protein UlaG (beta-lactamase superfamily)